VASVARALTAGQRAPTSAGDQVRDFLHVADVGGAFAALVAGDVRGPVNIGSGEGVAVRELVELIAREAGRPDLLDIGALPPRPRDPPALVADVTRLRDEVGFTPSIRLEEGVRETVTWWRAVATKADPRQHGRRGGVV
jgi:nucleoside-diphosphate-sugar epimerase